MLLHPSMEEGLNQQIKHELESAYVYLAMAAYCEANDHEGIAKWLQVQSKEEVEHAMRFYRFINERGGRVALQALGQPASDFKSLVDVFERALQNEVKVTALIHGLYEKALQEKDYASIPFLQEFIAEQVEEEGTANRILAEVKRIDSGAALMRLDRELAERMGTD